MTTNFTGRTDTMLLNLLPNSAPRHKPVGLQISRCGGAEYAAQHRDWHSNSTAKEQSKHFVASGGPNEMFKEAKEGGRWICSRDATCRLQPLSRTAWDGCSVWRQRAMPPRWGEKRHGRTWCEGAQVHQQLRHDVKHASLYAFKSIGPFWTRLLSLPLLISAEGHLKRGSSWCHQPTLLQHLHHPG